MKSVAVGGVFRGGERRGGVGVVKGGLEGGVVVGGGIVVRRRVRGGVKVLGESGRGVLRGVVEEEVQ